MHHLEVIRITHTARGWRVSRDYGAIERFFPELGQALDAASAFTSPSRALRVVVEAGAANPRS